MELSGFLREYGCPHAQLIEGDLEGRLNDKASCLLLLDYLITEYQAAQIYYTDKPLDLVKKLPSTSQTVGCVPVINNWSIVAPMYIIYQPASERALRIED